MSHFNFQLLGSDGMLVGEPTKSKTEAGIVILCPAGVGVSDIKHLCALARATPNYPVDITAWNGPENARYLTWAARISYENNATGMHKIRAQAE
jgi:hypothetical protein